MKDTCDSSHVTNKTDDLKQKFDNLREKFERRHPCKLMTQVIPKYFQILIQHKEEVEELLKLSKSKNHNLEYQCIITVEKEMLASKLKKNGPFEKTENEKVLNYHLAFLKRKREELQKKFDSKYRDNYRAICASLKRLLDVKSYMDTDYY